MKFIKEIIWGRYTLLSAVILTTLILAKLSTEFSTLIYLTVVFTILTFLGLYDSLQKKRSVLTNYPLIGRMRFLFESIRPELRQYFWESDDDKVPYSRNQRAMVYQRAKNIHGIRPFGSLEEMYGDDYVWLNHSITPSVISDQDFRVKVGQGENAYNISVLNISGTSFGALSPNAITSFNLAAKKGRFAHNTGEGSFSKYHSNGGGDTIWQISTGYFGCRTKDGKFSEEKFKKTANLKQIKMIEIKISQGAKPGHGGMLLGSKVTEEIANTR